MSIAALVKGKKFQAWRTPRVIFDQLNSEVGYGIDAFADDENHLLDRYFTAKDDAIMQPWDCDRPVYGNPPYNGDMQAEALMKAILEVRTAKRCPQVDLLVQASVASKWFLLAQQTCEVHLFHGRINFDLPPSEINPRRPSFSNALVRVRPVGTGPIGITQMRSARTGKIITAQTAVENA